MKFAYIVVLAFLAFLLAGCLHEKSSDEEQRTQQEQLSQQANAEVGMPDVHKFTEKRMMKTILELRDKEVPTFTYLVGMNNDLKLLCHSVGFGLPYSTQYTNPLRVLKRNETEETGNTVLPQADPNGLFSPASSDGTWVQCLNPETKRASVVYVEPRIVVSPFALY